MMTPEKMKHLAAAYFVWAVALLSAAVGIVIAAVHVFPQHTLPFFVCGLASLVASIFGGLALRRAGFFFGQYRRAMAPIVPPTKPVKAGRVGRRRGGFDKSPELLRHEADGLLILSVLFFSGASVLFFFAGGDARSEPNVALGVCSLSAFIVAGVCLGRGAAKRSIAKKRARYRA